MPLRSAAEHLPLRPHVSLGFSPPQTLTTQHCTPATMPGLTSFPASSPVTTGPTWQTAAQGSERHATQVLTPSLMRLGHGLSQKPCWSADGHFRVTGGKGCPHSGKAFIIQDALWNKCLPWPAQCSMERGCQHHIKHSRHSSRHGPARTPGVALSILGPTLTCSHLRVWSKNQSCKWPHVPHQHRHTRMNKVHRHIWSCSTWVHI